MGPQPESIFYIENYFFSPSHSQEKHIFLPYTEMNINVRVSWDFIAQLD